MFEQTIRLRLRAEDLFYGKFTNEQVAEAIINLISHTPIRSANLLHECFISDVKANSNVAGRDTDNLKLLALHLLLHFSSASKQDEAIQNLLSITAWNKCFAHEDLLDDRVSFAKHIYTLCEFGLPIGYTYNEDWYLRSYNDFVSWFKEDVEKFKQQTPTAVEKKLNEIAADIKHIKDILNEQSPIT